MGRIRCKVCGIEKELTPDFFYFTKEGTCKNKTTCRQCLILKHREYNQKNRDVLIAKQRIYNSRPEVKKHKSEYKKKYKAEHLEIIKAKDAAYRKTLEARKLKHQYYIQHKEQIKARNKKHYQEHKQEVIERTRGRRQTDEIYRLKNNVRKAIRFALRFNDVEKCKRTEEITKIRIDLLRKHLLDTFKNRYGYDWDGIEEVEVDHIVPLYEANTKQEVLDLCYYTNLQLLRKQDNASKGFTRS